MGLKQQVDDLLEIYTEAEANETAQDMEQTFGVNNVGTVQFDNMYC